MASVVKNGRKKLWMPGIKMAESFSSQIVYAVKGSYRETWKFIKIDENSLKRFSNFYLFFKE